MDGGQRDEKPGTDHSNYARGLSEVSFPPSPEQIKRPGSTPSLVRMMGLQAGLHTVPPLY